MSASSTKVEINKRFFKAIEILKYLKIIKGLYTFTKSHNINYWNITTIKNNPEKLSLKVEWIAWLCSDYGISSEWILLGKGNFFTYT